MYINLYTHLEKGTMRKRGNAEPLGRDRDRLPFGVCILYKINFKNFIVILYKKLLKIHIKKAFSMLFII